MEQREYRIRTIKKQPRELSWTNSRGEHRSMSVSRPPRVIQAPKDALKTRQYEILSFLESFKVSSAAHGFVKGRSVRTNAEVHLGAPCLFCLDLRDFFPSVRESQIIQELVHRGVEKSHASEIANLCTLDGVLPQGAPTSPVLANLVCREMDASLTRLCESLGLKYTRYADDLTFSGSRDRLDLAKPRIQSIINRAGFRINGGKTKTQGRYREMEITGAVINHGIDAPVAQRNRILNIYHQANRLGIETRTEFEEAFGALGPIMGYAAYMSDLNPKHRKILQRFKRIANGETHGSITSPNSCGQGCPGPLHTREDLPC